MNDDRNFFQYFMRGIEPTKYKMTRNPRIWTMYLAWCIHGWLWYERAWRTGWRNKTASWLSKFRGGMSHRCEFTDREDGALYTGKVDAFMDRAIRDFIKTI